MSSDELGTMAISQLGSWPAIWQADLNKADGMPPLFHYIEGLALRMPVAPEIALRIPSMIGFSLVVPALFFFVTPRAGELSGSIAACLPLVTVAYWYSSEARNYALTLGLTAVALIAWRKARTQPGSRVNPILLALLLAASSGISYNAIYGWLALVFVEAVASVQERRIHWAVAVALLSALIPFAFYWPILRGFQRYYGPGFWSKPSLGLVVTTVSSWANFSTALFLLLMTTFGVLVLLWFRGGASQATPPAQVSVPTEEWILGAAFSAIPVILYVVAKLMKGGMVYRYSICMILGVSLITAFATRRARPAIKAAITICAIVAFASLGLWHLAEGTNPTVALWKMHPLLEQVADGRTPIVVADGTSYVQLAYYSTGSIRSQLYYIVDPSLALRYLGTDTVDLTIAVQTHYLPLQVSRYQEFISGHPEFLVYARSEWDWLTPYLLDQGRSVRLLSKNDGWVVYRVNSR